MAPFVPVPNVEVGAADAGGFDLDEHIVRARFGNGHIFDNKAWGCFGFADGFHGFHL